MRYLKQREEFIKNNNFSNYSLIKEDSGPLANDIPWGDSLLGRLINSVIRKSKVGVNLTRIDSLIERLKSTFDGLIADATIKGSELGKDTALKIDRYLMSALLGELKNVIEKSNKEEIIKATKGTIDSIKSLQISKESEESRKDLLSKLDEFLKSIDIQEEDIKTDVMISNLSHLSKIMQLLQTNKEVVPRKMKIKIGGFYVAHLYDVDKLVKVVSISNGTTKAILFENGKPTSQIEIPVKSILKEVRYEIKPSEDEKSDSIVFNLEDTKSISDKEIVALVKRGSIAPSGVVESTIFESEDQTSNVSKDKLRKSVDLLIKNDKGLSINPEFINDLITQFKNNPNDSSNGLNSPSYVLTNIYREVYSCLKGDRASTVPDLGKVTESLEILRKNKNKIPVAGELIARFAKRTSQFEENNLFEKLGDLGAEVHAFNTTLQEIIGGHIGLPDYRRSKNVEPKTESIVKYSNFILLKEAEETVAEPEKKKDEFIIPFNKVFNQEYMKKWIVTEEEAKSLQYELNKIPKESTKIVIDGIDPIIEIVKIFNRSYKIFTTKTIPSGRSGGRVSNKVFNEYSWIGDSGDGGSPDKPSTGAWRNDALFDKWESAVLDIIKDPKYQVLFNEETTIKVGSSDPRINIVKKNGTRKQGGGKVLLSFINAMLDGSKLYKSGAQAKFMTEYFDVEVPNDVLGWSGKGGKDVEINAGTAQNAKDSDKKKYSFKEIKEVSPKYTSLYALKTAGKKYYLSILESDAEFVYVKYSETFFSFNKLATKIAKIDRGSMDGFIDYQRDKNTNDIYPVFYARIPNRKFPLKVGEEMEIKSLNLLDYEHDKDTIRPEASAIPKIEKIYGVINDENKLLVLPDDIKIQMNKNKEKYKEKLNEKKK